MKDCDKMKILAFVIIGMFFKAVLSVKRTRKLSLQEKVGCLILLSSCRLLQQVSLMKI